MDDTVAGTASERAAESVGVIVENAVAQVDGAVEAIEARAEAAEAALETLVDAQHRDGLHDEIEAESEEREEWQNEHHALHEQLNNRMSEMAAQLLSLEERLTELANKSTVTTVSIPAGSTEPASIVPSEPVVTVTTVDPGSAAPAVIPEPVAPASRRRWI